MNHYIEVPPMGEQKQTETQLNCWLVKEGQAVKSGDDVAELVTDKAAFNLPAARDCKVLRFLVKEGSVVKPGDKLVEIEVAG